MSRAFPSLSTGMSRILGPGWEDMKEGDVGESTDSVSAHL